MGARLPRCRQQTSAACVTCRENGRGAYTCFRPAAQCDEFRRELLHPDPGAGDPDVRHDAVSACAEVR